MSDALTRLRHFRDELRSAVHEIDRFAAGAETRLQGIRSDKSIPEITRQFQLSEAVNELDEDVAERVAAMRIARQRAAGQLVEWRNSRRVDPASADRARKLLVRGVAPATIVDRALATGDVETLAALRAELPWWTTADREFVPSESIEEMIIVTEEAMIEIRGPSDEGLELEVAAEIRALGAAVEERAEFAILAVQDQAAGMARLEHAYATADESTTAGE